MRLVRLGEHPGMVGEGIGHIRLLWGKGKGKSRCGEGRDRAHPVMMGGEIGHIQL